MRKQIAPTWTLLALAISAFAIGSTEFISVGLMPLLVKSFGITVSQAGWTVSIYALGITIGAPLLTLLTGRFDRKTLMLGIMTLFVVSSLLAALAPTFAILLVARVLAAFAHGLFMSVASVIAADVVAPAKRASAIAVMFTGLTVATVTGVPLGTFIGQIASWHMSFLFISAIGVIGLIANSLLIPRNLPRPGKTDPRGLLRILLNPQLFVALLITVLGYGGTFTVYTFLSPLLEEKMGWSAAAVVVILVVYGLMVAVGNTLGGRWANLQPLQALRKMFIGLALTLVALLATSSMHYLGLINVLVMGFFAFMNVPGLQLYIVKLAETYTPNDITLASSLNISAFNIGIALGSLIGGQVTAKLDLGITPLFGAVIVGVSIILVSWLLRQAATVTDCTK
ncbi:MFS transporter [Loigolactobacillus coryniformis]|uniref:MFS sugar transporter n=1 Tax=Loigolactobacillus coryniformis subsp. torquens DSM 20004 = KCTC 3535 TaxID=1423822 RepID=A0A2D1KR63_9LACO|nr:MFS transporter [Loigolactobacillus coryniformis]ATO44624.1 MFS sugar transporter [Loigolactobacillus coryniformis subsp. torquens DSM 20004 = KCTC 3535]KRK72452.1 transport protein [Loigolactobacillus coryniformis subsp. torquens DSM 20004 = KCTC 3535]